VAFARLLLSTVISWSGLLAPRVGDLLEDLAHAGTHQLAAVGLGVVVAPVDPGSLARVEVVNGGIVGFAVDIGLGWLRRFIALHVGIVNARASVVNGPSAPG
jgi:hypothetical protein